MPYITDLKPSCSVPVASEMNAGEVAEPSVPQVPAGEENLADIQPAQENVAPGEQADEMTKRLDEILSRMAEKNCRSLSENELENGLSRVRRDIEVALKDLDGQANPDVRLMNVLGASKGQIEYLAHQREAAEAALREFGTLTGADISQAMALRAAGREGEASAAEKRTLAVIDHAIGTQQAMANAFEDLYRACEGRYAELYDCATRCTARATEIFALSGQLALLAQPEGANAPDRARLLAATARKLLPEYGLKMHGTDTAIEMLRRELKPIADAYAKLNARQGDGAPRPTDLAELALLKARLDTARQALQLVAEEGIVYAEGEDAFRPEPSLLLTLGGQLEQVAIQIDTVLNRSSEALAKGFAREVFVDPLETGFLGENLADILNATGLGTGEEVVSNAREKLAYLSKMSRDYSRALTELAVTGNDASLRQVRAELNSSQGQAACQFVRGLGMRLIVLKCHVERKDPPEIFKRVRVNAAGFRRAFGTSERQRKLIDGLKAMSSVGLLSGCFNLGRSVRLDGAEKQIRALRNRMASFDIGETLNDKLLVSVLKGETTVSSVLAARAWGVNLADVDLVADDANLVSEKELGSGQANTTYLCTYRGPDGQEVQRVFKPDFSASQALLDLTLGKNGTYSDLQRIANLNIASAEVAEMLGTPSTVVKSRVGIHNGMFGIFMEVASGTAPGDIFDRGGNRDGIRLGDYTVGELKTLKITKPQDYLRFVGNLMHALNDLEWNDLITGQGDRHWCNYMVHVNRDLTVKVHGIDNDAAFPEWRLGAEKFQLSGERLVTFRELAESKGGPWTFDPAKLPEGSATPLRGVTVGPNGTLIVDVSRNRKLAPYMQSVFGIQKIITPRAISRQTYDRLCEMRELAHNDRDQFVSRFADKLTEGQIEAMIVRLEDAWQRAENLRAQGLVLDGEKRDAQNPAENHPDQWCQASIRVRIVDGMVRDGYDNGQLNVITSELIVGDWLGVSGEINLPRSLRNVDGSYANV